MHNNLDDPFLDARTKLLPCQRERLVALRAEGLTYPELGRVFNVSKHLAWLVVNPDKKAHALAMNRARKQDGRYDDPVKAAAHRRRTRERKQQLLTT